MKLIIYKYINQEYLEKCTMTRPERQYIDGERGMQMSGGITIIEMKLRDIERINAKSSREKMKITNSAAFLKCQTLIERLTV